MCTGSARLPANRGPVSLRSGTGGVTPMMTTPPPAGYHLDAAALGYAIGRLLRHTSYRSYRSLRTATIAFLTDAGISFAAMSDQEKEVLFRSVGSGYARLLPGHTPKEMPNGPNHHRMHMAALAQRSHHHRLQL